MTAVSEPILDVQSVSRRFGVHDAVCEASFRLDPGEINCLLGPSGCGKSTLLRMIAGLEPVDGGTISIVGRPVSAPGVHIAPESRNVGLVFQDFALFPHLTVEENIGFGLTRMTAPARGAIVADLLARFHIENLARTWPHTLSGGEQQRVALARALARQPALLLLDEPFSGLDGHMRAQVRRSVMSDLRATGTTVLIVTHDPEEAMQVADRIVLMAAGRILQVGTPQDCYRRPVSPAAARLLGEAILLPARIEAGMAHTALGAFGTDGLPDGAGVLVVRPEALRLDSGGPKGTVTAVRFVGASHIVELRICDAVLEFRISGEPPKVGELVGLSVDRAGICVFPQEKIAGGEK